MKKNIKNKITNFLQAAVNEITLFKFNRCNGIDYTYNTSNCIGCEGYCRCSQIIDTKITKLNLVELSSAFIESIKTEYTNKIDKYCVDRIFHSSKLKNQDNWNIDIGSGYYGEEVYGCSPNREIINQIADTLNSMIELSDVDKIKACLKEEYGYVLPQLQTKKNIEIITINLNDIEIGNDIYARKLEKEYVDQYDDFNLPRGIVVANGNSKYRLIDGYHRITSALNKSIKNIDVIQFK